MRTRPFFFDRTSPLSSSTRRCCTNDGSGLRSHSACCFSSQSCAQPPANKGCYLEVVPNRKLVWTDALLPGYRPSLEPFFTARLTMEPEGAGTRYIATAIHRDPEGRTKHEEMGFHEGWSQVLDQLVEYAKTM